MATTMAPPATINRERHQQQQHLVPQYQQQFQKDVSAASAAASCATALHPHPASADFSLQPQQADLEAASDPSGLATAATSAPCRFVVPTYFVPPGHSLAVTGSLPALGSWSERAALRLSPDKQHNWSGDVVLPIGTPIECKVVVLGPGGEVTRCEPDGNRRMQLRPPPPTRQPAFDGVSTRGAGGSTAAPPPYAAVCRWGHTRCTQVVNYPNAAVLRGDGECSDCHPDASSRCHKQWL